MMTGERNNPRGRRAQVLGLLVLAPVCAEYLAAYHTSTGDPQELLLGLLIFAPLYGAPALIIREVARRAGLGWIGMILMASAFGLMQAGVVDQSLFSTGYLDIDSWAESRQPTLIAPLGISAHMAQLFLAGHVIYSICAPIALIEALGPDHRRTPWLGKLGLAVTAVLYVAVSVLVLVDHLTTESSHASATQVVASLVLACGLIVAAFVVGRRARARVDRPAPRPLTAFIASFVAATTVTASPETWPGVALAVGALTIGAMLLGRAARAITWDARHAAAVAAGAVLSRGLLAFTYFPVTGDVDPGPKYAHNIVFLVSLTVLSVFASRRAAHSG
jgi:hypothetical protein